jgi:hypothetical protein
MTVCARIRCLARKWAPVVISARFAVAVLFVLLLFYLYREVARDALIIDPFAVPKPLADAGLTLTGDVVAKRIGEQIKHIERISRTRMRTDNPVASQDQTAIPDMEIPGTNLGLRTAVDVARSLLNVYPIRVSGDMVLSIAPSTGQRPTPSDVTMTIYVTRGRARDGG